VVPLARNLNLVDVAMIFFGGHLEPADAEAMFAKLELISRKPIQNNCRLSLETMND